MWQHSMAAHAFLVNGQIGGSFFGAIFAQTQNNAPRVFLPHYDLAAPSRTPPPQAAAMRDRAAKQGSQVQLDATIEVATRILDVLDNYDRAFQAVEAATDEEEEILATYRKTQDMVVEAFAELNVTRIATVGEEFDYELHQALMQIPSEEHEEGIVCQEMALGWKCGDRLIRPAMVAVAL